MDGWMDDGWMEGWMEDGQQIEGRWVVDKGQRPPSLLGLALHPGPGIESGSH